MITGWLEANLVSVITVGASVVYFISKLESSTKNNMNFFKAEISHLTDIIRLNHENLQSEIKRMKEKNEDDLKNIKENIGRLERKQEESNRIKERLSIAEVSLKSLHKRLDIEPTIQLKRPDEE